MDLLLINLGILRIRILTVLVFIVVMASGFVFAKEPADLKQSATEAIAANQNASTEVACTNLSASCAALCRAFRLDESRAMAMEIKAKETRSAAEEAKHYAVFYEDLARQKTVDSKQPKEKPSQSAQSSPILLWKTADYLLRLLVPPHARNNDQTKNISSMNSTSRSSANALTPQEKDADKARKKANQAWVEAETAIEKAEAAEKEAEQARTAADQARISYEGCLGK
jgi:hypothetical protein